MEDLIESINKEITACKEEFDKWVGLDYEKPSFYNGKIAALEEVKKWINTKHI